MRKTDKHRQLRQTPLSKTVRLPALRSQKSLLKPRRTLLRSPSKPLSLPSDIRVKQVSCGTMSIISRNSGPRLSTNCMMNGMPERYRNSLKLRTIKWLLSAYREEIDRILSNCKAMLLQASSRGYLTSEQFRSIMITLGLEDDPVFIDRLFWVFDDNSNGLVEAKEVIIGLEIFRKNSFHQKLELFFDICDIDGSGDIDEDEFFNTIKMCVPNESQRRILRKSVHELFTVIDTDHSGSLTKEELIQAASKSNFVKNIIEKTVRATSDEVVHHQDPYQPPDVFSLTTSSGRTNGFYHRGFDKLFKAVSEFEKNTCPYSAKNNELLTHWKKTNGNSYAIPEEDSNLLFDSDGEEIGTNNTYH